MGKGQIGYVEDSSLEATSWLSLATQEPVVADPGVLVVGGVLVAALLYALSGTKNEHRVFPVVQPVGDVADWALLYDVYLLDDLPPVGSALQDYLDMAHYAFGGLVANNYPAAIVDLPADAAMYAESVGFNHATRGTQRYMLFVPKDGSSAYEWDEQGEFVPEALPETLNATMRVLSNHASYGDRRIEVE